MATIGKITSRLRESIKATNGDAFITDRYLYSLVIGLAHGFMRRDNVLNNLMNYNNIMKTIPCVNLIEIDKLHDACCVDIKSGCTIRRSEKKLTDIIESTDGPVIKFVSTLDNSERFIITDPVTFNYTTKSKNFKYNKSLYFWYIDGYLYFPNVDFDAVKITGLFETDVTGCSPDDQCKLVQDSISFIPDNLLGEIEAAAEQKLYARLQIPGENSHDKQNINR